MEDEEDRKTLAEDQPPPPNNIMDQQYNEDPSTFKGRIKVQLEKPTVDHSYHDCSHISDEELYEWIKHHFSPAGESTIYDRGQERVCETTKIIDRLEKRSDISATAKLQKLLECLLETGGLTVPFPLKLMEILANPSTQHIISWMPHGRAFKIFDHIQFVEIVLPQYFPKNIKYTSFVRQLNVWDFKRLTNKIDRGAYYHERFLRGKPMLVMRMKRKKIKGTRVKLASDPATEPNFYSMESSDLVDSEVVNSMNPPAAIAHANPWSEKPYSEGFNPLGLSRSLSEVELSPSPAVAGAKDHITLKRLQREVRQQAETVAAAQALVSPGLSNGRAAEGPPQGPQVSPELCKAALPFRRPIGMVDVFSRRGLIPPEQMLRREIADSQLILCTHRQELALWTELADLKKQEYEIMARLCRALEPGAFIEGPHSVPCPLPPLALLAERNEARKAALSLLGNKLAFHERNLATQFGGQ